MKYALARSLFIALWILGSVAACSSDNDREEPTGKGSIRALHTISNIGAVDFLIEETVLGRLGFREASGISQYDDLEYNFRFEIDLPGNDDPTVLGEQTLQVTTDQEYTFVLSGSLDEPTIFLWEQFGRNWAEEQQAATDNDTEITVMEVSFGHVSPSLDAVDIYLEAPGTGPAFAVPKATLAYSDFQEAIELTASEYQLVVTPADDPDTILFASNELEFNPASSTLVTLMDDGGTTTAEISVSLIGAGSSSALADINSSSIISTVHAALGSGAVDIYDSDDFSSPIIEDLDFGSRSEEIVVNDGETNLVTTPFDNIGVFLNQQTLNAATSSYNRLYLVGLPGDLQFVAQRYNHATLATHARFQLFQAAVRFQSLDVYLVDVTTDIQLIGPTFSSMVYGTGQSYVNREAKRYNVFVTEPGTKNVIAGPVEVTLEENRNYSLTIVDSADISAAEILFFDDTEPQ